MVVLAEGQESTTRLLSQITCPHCWHEFASEEILWAAEHQDLAGDPVLGPDQRQRFLPSRFDPDCNAIDARGFACYLLACPRCHLVVPRQLLESEPIFVSVLGAPSSGKSYYLASMTWTLRHLLPQSFALDFGDADPTLNQTIIDSEAALFLNQVPETPVPLASLINKTALDGDLYDVVKYGDQPVKYVRPLVFHIRPKAGHARYSDAHRAAKALCVYDNAGEHFQPGMDTTASPVTRHLALSRFLLFLFDPTQDPRFRSAIEAAGGARSAGPQRNYKPQVPILQEAATRVRRFANLPQTARHDRPLLVVLTKRDQWNRLLPDIDATDPWVKRPNEPDLLDFDAVEGSSRKLRELLLKTCQDVVNTAEGFCQDVYYFAASALGPSVGVDPATGAATIAPAAVRPSGAAAPMLYALARWQASLVSGGRRRIIQKGTAAGGKPT
jgi:hypothetical protein